MNNYTLFHYAAFLGNWKMIELLLSLGADPMLTNTNKVSALHIAA